MSNKSITCFISYLYINSLMLIQCKKLWFYINKKNIWIFMHDYVYASKSKYLNYVYLNPTPIQLLIAALIVFSKNTFRKPFSVYWYL